MTLQIPFPLQILFLISFSNSFFKGKPNFSILLIKLKYSDLNICKVYNLIIVK